MYCDTFHLACVILLVTYANAVPMQCSANADESSEDCRKENIIEVKQGEELTLTSTIDPLKRCYFVFTKNDSGDQCCYNRRGNNEDCDTSDKYKRSHMTKCPEYDLIVDSVETGTCILTIKSAREADAGEYKSYDADDLPIQGSLVTVSGRESSGGGIGALIGFTFALPILLVGTYVILQHKCYPTKTTDTNHNIEDSVRLSSIEVIPKHEGERGPQ